MDSAEETSNETGVRLIVKAPDQQIDDHVVQCKLDWTVAMLKDHLSEVYPSKPKRTEQKIIFSGQLLNDLMILKDVLQQYYNKDDRSFIVHLVCGGQSSASSTARAKTNSAVSGAGNSVNSQSTATAAAAPSLPQPTPVEQYYSQLNNQQMAWMQQAYAHYLTQYTQFMATQGIQLQSTSPYTRPLNATAARASDAANNNNAIANNNNADENEDTEARGTRDARVAEAVGAPAAGDANAANNNNNNNNAPADEAPGAAALNRDWLDIFDMLSRIVVLSSIVYFYSSPSRFLIVTFLGFAIYLIQGGFFRGQPVFLAENNNARLENNNQVGQNEAPAPAPAAPQQAPRNAANAGGRGEPVRTNVNEENERPGALAFTWTFFSSFFASLIPDQPNVI